MRHSPNEPIIDIDMDMVKEFEDSKLGRELKSRLTPPPTSKMIMQSNPTGARNAYFDLKENQL